MEKAAAFLSSDKFGRLSYPQVLALLSSEKLLKAADDFKRFPTAIPQPAELRGFARLYYIKAILLPEQSDYNRIGRHQFREVLSYDDLKYNHDHAAVLLAAPFGDESPLREQVFAIMDPVV